MRSHVRQACDLLRHIEGLLDVTLSYTQTPSQRLRGRGLTCSDPRDHFTEWEQFQYLIIPYEILSLVSVIAVARQRKNTERKRAVILAHKFCASLSFCCALMLDVHAYSHTLTLRMRSPAQPY